MRLFILGITTLLTTLLILIWYPILPKRRWAYVIKIWAWTMLKIMGIQLIVTVGQEKQYIKSNTMVIANHISWLDMLVLYTQYAVQFVARAEVRKWPVISLLIKSSGAIFINRTRKRDLININQFVSQKLINGAAIGLFPEGKTSSGMSVLPFSASLLKAPILANSTIIPVVIKYYTINGSPTTNITYAGNITFWQSLRNSLLLNGIIVKVAILNPVQAADFQTRNHLAVFLHNQISHQFNQM